MYQATKLCYDFILFRLYAEFHPTFTKVSNKDLGKYEKEGKEYDVS